MTAKINVAELTERGCAAAKAEKLTSQVNGLLRELPAAQCWQKISKELLTPADSFELHRFFFETVYAEWQAEKSGPPPAWLPSERELQQSNIGRMMQEKGMASYTDFHKWSVENRETFWQELIDKLGIDFDASYNSIVDLSGGVDAPQWLPGAKFNIARSCFPEAQKNEVAIVYKAEGGAIQKMSYDALDRLSNRVANSLVQAGFKAGDAIAIDMLMTVEAVAIYLGIVKAGCAVIGIADSFAPDEIATRLRIGKAKGIFTQDFILRGSKSLPMYEKVTKAEAPRAIVLPAKDKVTLELRSGDISWKDFLVNNEVFDLVPADPHNATNILFSSGTTGDPKAIPWTQTTPLKCGVDAYLHHDIQPGDVLAWPTSLGWMMGPWLIYAALLNKASMALYYGVPTGKEFAQFVQDAKITMLGVVPSLVKAWKNSGCLKGLDWSGIKIFSSTGECSNAEDMLFLMASAGYKPVIEYCGGTEIGGGYITGTVVQPASPATFSTASLGLDLQILDEAGKPADNGEVFVVPPSIGLSTELLNRDHHEVYYNGTPTGPHGEVLRRHGDQMERLAGGFFRAHGRADDTMNLGGIKISSAEIERVLNSLPEVHETAAIAVPPKGGGPSLLVIYTVTKPDSDVNKEELKGKMQQVIKSHLNPLFKIHEAVLIEALPRTASNKVMRRVLRAEFVKTIK